MNLSEGELDEDDVAGGEDASPRAPVGRHPAAAEELHRRRGVVAVENLCSFGFGILGFISDNAGW